MTLHLARSADVSSSHEAAEREVRSGRVATELNAALRAVERHSGHTSKELPLLTEDIGLEMLHQGPERWRMTLARRLPNLDDKGLIAAEAPSYSPRRPWRRVNPKIAPCGVSGVRSIRWHRKGDT